MRKGEGGVKHSAFLAYEWFAIEREYGNAIGGAVHINGSARERCIVGRRYHTECRPGNERPSSENAVADKNDEREGDKGAHHTLKVLRILFGLLARVSTAV